MPSSNNVDELETLLLFLHLKIRGTGTQKPIYSMNVYHAWKIVLSSLRVATMFYKKSKVNLRTSIEKSSWQVW